MDTKEKYIDDLAAIRSVMERSTRYLSLSGISSILAGIYALIGGAIGYRIIYYSDRVLYEDLTGGAWQLAKTKIFLVAIGVFMAALVTAVWMSYRKAKADGQSLFNQTAIRLLINFSIPMAAGGIFIILLYEAAYIPLIAPSMLLFYGLALLNAGNFTFSDIRQLGMVEIVLGLLATAFPGKGLLFWIIGFGIFHIIYGVIIYVKYER